MILTPYELPSRGQDPNSESISFNGLGFQDMITYSEEYESAKTPLQKFIVDFNWTKKLIPNWRTINLVDLDAVILRWKIASVSETNEFSVRKVCPNCGTPQVLELSVEQFDNFLPIEYGLTSEIVLNKVHYQVKCPSLDHFNDVITKTNKSGRIKYVNLLKIISMIPDFDVHPNQVESAVLNARLSDIQVLKTIETVYLRSKITVKTSCSHCKGGDWSMGVASLIDNPFLSLVLSTGSIEDKITIGEIRRNDES